MPNQYIPNNTANIRKRMMDAIGIKEIDELFSCLIHYLRLKRDERSKKF